MKSLDPSSRISAISSSVQIKQNIVKQLIDSSYVVVPLAQHTKRPLVRWKRYKQFPPSRAGMRSWFDRLPGADIGILTSLDSGIICLDCDKPPYPKGVYTQTPSGGRHYWYRQNIPVDHGTNVSPGHDIPWIVKVYAVPEINEGAIPENFDRVSPATRAETNTDPVRVYGDIPYELYFNCEFIDWFNIAKLDPLWDGRYPLARAYASNIINSDAPFDIRELGHHYRHESQIYDTITKPHTCGQIVRSGFKCRYYNRQLDCCNKDRKSRSPFGLATSLRKE